MSESGDRPPSRARGVPKLGRLLAGLSSGRPGVKNETRTRVITGVLGGVFLLALLVQGGAMGVNFATAVLGGLMCWELSNVFFTMPDRREKLIALVGLAWLTTFVGSLFPKSMLECLIASFMGLFTYYLAVAERHPESLRKHFDELVFSTFVLVYVITFITFLPLSSRGLQRRALAAALSVASSGRATRGPISWGASGAAPSSIL